VICIENDLFSVHFSEEGQMERISLKNDATGMNWLIDRSYLQELEYPDEDKLTGIFSARIGGQTFSNDRMKPELEVTGDGMTVKYVCKGFTVCYIYSLKADGSFIWDIALENSSSEDLFVDNMYVWLSLAYIMFQDKDTIRNMTHSCALFPSISNDFSKLAAVKRDNRGPNLGIYNTIGKTASYGSYCRYTNNFLLQVSPSLDGVIFHNLVLIDSDRENKGPDWIYSDLGSSGKLPPGGSLVWQYVFKPFFDYEEFEQNGSLLGHPIMDYSPVVPVGGIFEAALQLPKDRMLKKAWIQRRSSDGTVCEDVTALCGDSGHLLKLKLEMKKPGESKFLIELDNGKIDFAVFNVSEPIHTIIEERIDYLCRASFNEAESAFGPLSNQGESLGKLCLILRKNLIASKDLEQVRKVEKSASAYIKNTWFIEGNFNKPDKIYGNFYRIFDFDYIAHVFYLLSQFDEQDLSLHPPTTYLHWAAEVMIMRFSEDMHDDDREKKETKLTGVFTLYIMELIESLREAKMTDEWKRLSGLWQVFALKLSKESEGYKGVLTEHFFDNAGFGPACEALCLSGHLTEAAAYGQLILANIGRSNDYRSQNPDRWWESLAYMLHSLWGGLVSNSARVAYEHLKNPDYVKAAYRSMMPLFFCYDWNAVSTEKRLMKGEAASTYCVTNPNMNKPSLSHNRFGQSAFLEDGEVFANATGDDWDMGEELVAYLNGFGTKTYLYSEGNEIKCINGHIEKDRDHYVITSYAAYPREYIFYEKNLHYKAEGRRDIPQIFYQKNRFVELIDE
jgi:hypothetical protein